MAGTLMVGGRVAPVVPQSFEEVQRIAGFLEQTGLVPKALNSIPKIIAVMMKGMEVGFPPMQAIEVIALINGKMTIYGDGIPALIHASGLCEEFTEHFEGEGDDFKAVCVMRRKGSMQSRRVEFSVADAKRARLWDTREKVKRKNFKTDQWEDAPNDAPWFRYPKRMLQMRARGWCARDEFSDVLRGIHIAEEVEDQARQVEQQDEEPLKANPLIDPGQLALGHSEPVQVPLASDEDRAIEVSSREADVPTAVAAPLQHDEPTRNALLIGPEGDRIRLEPFGDGLEPSRLIQFIGELERAEDLLSVKASADGIAQYVGELAEEDRVYFRQVIRIRRAAIEEPTYAAEWLADLAAVKEWVMAGCAS